MSKGLYHSEDLTSHRYSIALYYNRVDALQWAEANGYVYDIESSLNTGNLENARSEALEWVVKSASSYRHTD